MITALAHVFARWDLNYDEAFAKDIGTANVLRVAR